ncbi:response regulator transcription factor [Acuticoccus sp. M5D2P5]|uniref:response regulator transcription factor n=1 Tax=Acuticoccus kalidii TaxID=2910977 RepID=UPI001F41B2FA|nr:response regulator transcription factor [Acuticoccus kalidii]MCF3932938.1 response regulator transcription factor [Acuticoccus kalidii]
MRILVVEDDDILGDGLAVGLGLQGFTVDLVATVADADAALATGSFAAIVLDVMLPDGNGRDILARMRRGGDPTPVIILTAQDGLADRLAGLDGGADDHLGKPFELEELAARLRALVRRNRGHAAPTIDWNGVTLEPSTLSASREGAPIPVSRREFTLLHALMETPGAILSRAQLEDRVYGFSDGAQSNAIEVHIHNLRSKFGGRFIETVRGVGYRVRRDGL